MKPSRVITILLLWVIASARLVTATDLDLARFQGHVKALTADPNRLAGTPEGQRAGDYVESQLHELRGQVHVQHFSFPQQITEACELRTSTDMIPLQALAANGMQPSVTPEEGIRGDIIYIGKGTDAEVAGKKLQGCIAVADFASRGAMNQAFRLGAKAIIFVGGEGADRFSIQDKRSHISIDLPRFYVSQETADRTGLLNAGTGTLVSKVAWQKQIGRSFFLFIPGTKPTFKQGKEEFVILSAYYDSEGIIPGNSPSHEAAANCAALIETARMLSENPPRRSVLIAFFDNHANFLEGGRQFYTAYRRSIPDRIEDPLPVRQKFVQEERKSLSQLLTLAPNALNGTHPGMERVRLLLKEEAKYRYGSYQEQLTDLRMQIERLRKSNQDTQSLQAKLETLQAEQRAWQVVREVVRDQSPVPASAEAQYRLLIAGVTNRLKNRLQELDDLSQQLGDSVVVTAPLTNATPVLHASFRFTGGSRRWLFVPHGTVHERLYNALIDKAASALDTKHRDELGFVWQSKTAASSYVNWTAQQESELASVFEIPSLTFVTEQDRAPMTYMPDARCSQEQLERIYQQANASLAFLRIAANGELMSVPNRVVLQRKPRMEDYQWKDNEAVGHQVKSFGSGQTSADRIEPNVLVHIMDDRYRSMQQAGTDAGPSMDDRWSQSPEYVTFADANGCFPLIPVLNITPPPAGSAWRAMLIEAARFDSDGRISAITVASPTSPLGSVSAGWSRAGYYWTKTDAGYYSILNMFSGQSGMLIGDTMPFGERWKPNAFKILNGLSNGTYKRVHFRFDPLVGVGVYYIDKPLGVKVVYEDPKNEDDVALYIHSTANRVTGIGYGPGSDPSRAKQTEVLDLRTALAPDMFALNESRLSALRSKNIILNSMERLHSRTKELLAGLQPANVAERHGDAETLAGKAASLERRVYRPVIAVTNDMVVAVTILLILAIPFAFGLQSLLLSTYNVYRRIAGFALFFVLTFAVLYFVHPAFAFAATPIIILLAFVILVMSAGVIWIIGDKFVYEIKKMQGLAAAAHTFDRSLFGNVGAAVALAISIMRRRPARTALTVVTVIFLTFTILSFVSFQTEKGVNQYIVGVGDQTSRLMFHRKAWKSMDHQVLADMRSSLGSDSQLHGRYWKAKELTTKADLEPLTIPILRQGGGLATAGAIMSLDAMEISNIPAVREVVPGSVDQFAAGKGVYLSETIAKELHASPGDTLRIQGVDVAFLGTFDSRRLANLRELDGSPMLPINFGMSQMALGGFESKGTAGASGADLQRDMEDALARLEPQALEPVSADSVILAPSQLHGVLGMSLKAVVMYPPAGSDLAELAERTAILHDDGVYLNQGGETKLFHYGDKYGVTGVGDVVIPLILGGLIIFSTMLGSVIDREKEIYTFSALGLAPRNIAMLFFVEAGVYAVVGGFGGYLFSQVVVEVLQLLASHGLFHAPEMNYSSSTAINTILIVMATVIVSTIYPAIQAARKATADTARRWRVPAPKGDVCEFNFPFTISQYDITGILCFIREHFVSHADRTVGDFASDEVALFREPQHGMAALRSTIWLQPFDQGISQRFELTAHPSDIEEVCEIHVRIERLSGPPSAWTRANTLFLEDIRRQFLLWRTLDDEERDQYLAVAAETEHKLETATV